jgi:hypothetical protein
MSQRKWLVVTAALGVYALVASFGWWLRLRPAAAKWGNIAELLGAVASILAFSYAFYTTRQEIVARKKADQRADDADARARAGQEAIEDRRKRQYANQVSWWTEGCIHPRERKSPQGKDDDWEAVHEHPVPGEATHHRPYMPGYYERGSGWPRDDRDVTNYDLILVDLHVRNTGPHPLYACGVKSSSEDVHFIGTVTDQDSTFLERALGYPGGTSSSFEVIGQIDAGADVEWIQFADAMGQDWRLDRQQQLTPMPRSSRLKYHHP